MLHKDYREIWLFEIQSRSIQQYIKYIIVFPNYNQRYVILLNYILIPWNANYRTESNKYMPILWWLTKIFWSMLKVTVKYRGNNKVINEKYYTLREERETTSQVLYNELRNRYVEVGLIEWMIYCFHTTIYLFHPMRWGVLIYIAPKTNFTSECQVLGLGK